MLALRDKWQQIIFAIFGFYPLSLSAVYLLHAQLQQASVAFAIAFLSFIYSNLSRFKRFKGLGFEAELWEDKQLEAEILINRLANLVSIYTREAVLGNVKRGRWGSEARWVDTWLLYDELIAQHGLIGQRVDLSNLKNEIDDYFLFDMYHHCTQACYAASFKAIEQATAIFGDRFADPVTDLEGHSEMHSLIQTISSPPIVDVKKIENRSNLAQEYAKYYSNIRRILRENFKINFEYEASSWEKLQKIAFLYENRPVKVTPELMRWASGTSN